MVVTDREILPGLKLGDRSDPVIMGIVNISPESFYKGSVIGPENIEKIGKFLSHGVRILDIGARSTAPGVVPIGKDEELDRIKSFLPKVLKILPEEGKKVVISIDTQFSEIAKYTLKECRDFGVDVIINDVSGLQTDKKMTDVVISYDVPLITMASAARPGDLLTVNSIMDYFFKIIGFLESQGYNTDKLIIDPGIGRWVPEKTYEYDLAIIDNLERFAVFNKPILVGISRKSFIGTVLGGKKAEERLYGSLAATVVAVYNGAHIIRTHDTGPILNDMIKMARAIRKRPVEVSADGITAEWIRCIKEPLDARYYMRLNIGVTPAGSRIMEKKAIIRTIMLKNITAPQALILKQEMLARGGEAAIHKNAVTTEHGKYDKNQNILLIGTEKQLESLISKLKGQQLELDKIADVLTEIMEKMREDKSLHKIT